MSNYAMNLPKVDVKQKEREPVKPASITDPRGKLMLSDQCVRGKTGLWFENGEVLASGVNEQDARRIAACWNRAEGFSTDLMAHPMAPRFMDQLWAMSVHNHKALSALSEARAELEKLRNRTIKEQLDELSDEQRMEIFGHYCTHCGCDRPECQCWNDE